MNMQFKIGDRVVRKKGAGRHGSVNEGEGGTVTDFDCHNQVQLDYRSAWHMSCSLKLIIKDNYEMY